MDRRRFLAAAGAVGSGSLAGCIGVPDLMERRSREPPVVADRPAAVYVPTHVDSMEMAGTTAVGDLRAAVAYSYPHRFWVVERDDGAFVTKRVAATAEDSVHLMVSVWEPETGLVVPDTGLSVAIRREGELVSQEVVYPMLSQRMGVHYGANFPLDGDGAYEVEVSVGGLDANRFGSFAGRFDGPATGTVTLEFATRTLNDITSQSLADRQGERGAVRPMEMASVPVGRAPESLPGTSLGRGSSGDATFLASAVSADRFGDDPYVVVSPRTPHNGLVVPGMALEATIDGGASFDGALAAGLDPELGFHYGAQAPEFADGERTKLHIGTPPQIARHEGYETAFLEMPPVTMA
jgi:hypothetical protein